MLLVPSATRVERTDTGADDLLRRLAALLPDAWIVAGAIASKPVSETGRRGHTQPFDAIVIGVRMIFVLDIWSHAGPNANRQKSGLFARFYEESRPDDFWQDFRRGTEKLKALLHDRFEVEPGRVTPEKIWIRAQRLDSAEAAAAADTAELRRFARSATRRDRAAMFAPLQKKAVDRLATFLTDDSPAAPKPTELFFSDGPTPTVVARTPAAPAKPAPIAPSGDAAGPASPPLDAAPPVVAEPATAAAPAPARSSPSKQDELLLGKEAPVAAPGKASPDASPALGAALPVVAKAAGAAAPAAAAPVRSSPPPQTEVSRPSSSPAPIARPAKAPAPASAEKDGPAPLLMPAPLAVDVAERAAARPAGGDASIAGAPHATPAPVAVPREASPPAPATKTAAAPAIAKAAAPAADAAVADARPEQVAPSVALAPARWRPIAHWKWLAALFLLLLVSQAGTIVWLALFDRASPQPAPAVPAAPAPAPAPAPTATAPVPEAPVPAPFVVRSLAASEPMRVGSETATLRAGPSPDFPAVGWLDAGTKVVASGHADGPGGSSWIEIASANGAVGFVPDNMVHPERTPALAIERAEPPKQTPAKIKHAAIERAAAPKQVPSPKVRRAVAPKPTPPLKIARATRPAQSLRPTAAPTPPRVTCILSGGEEIQATRSDCRAQSGIIYQ